MMIGLKDTAKLFGISIIACCAVFVCTLFLNYNADLARIENDITTPMGIVLYQAQVSMGKVTTAVTGGCLIATSVVMLLFYVKNYIDTHGKELGILKALGYSNLRIAHHFWIFGLSVLAGCMMGFLMAVLYLPAFYDIQNADGLLPDLSPQLYPLLAFVLTGMPAIVFAGISVLFAYFKLKTPVLDLLREKHEKNRRIRKNHEKPEAPFLKGLSSATLKSKKALAFFVAFSAFCFSAMIQMSFSMKKIASASFAWMTLLIGLILAFTTLFLSLTSVVKGNTKTIAMMKVFGYEDRICGHAILGAYRPVSYIGFVIGTIYQYVLLKSVLTLVFSDLESIPEYTFDFKTLVFTLIVFIITYELIMYRYASHIRKLSLKSIMLE